VSQRFRRPVEINAAYARRTTTVNNYRNRNAWQKKPKTIPVKRIAVHNAYNNVREVSAEFKVPCVKKTFGKEIVRVCCRTIKQLDTIAVILKHLMKVDFIIEIGMPLEYSYKMKTLVLFIKPKNKKISKSIKNVFEKFTVHYPASIVETVHPAVAAEKVLKELIANGSLQEAATIAQNIRILPAAEEMGNDSEELCHSKLLLFLKIGLIFFSLFLIFHHEE
jgi:hypothetical protein